MVLEIPGKLFGQDDVRETPTTAAEGTQYWSAPGCAWIPVQNTANSAADTTWTSPSTNGQVYNMAVFLPHGAVVTNVICYGDASAAAAETWDLRRIDSTQNNVDDSMATAAFNTADSSINNAEIDNIQYSYAIETTGVDTDDFLNGVVITYTI